MCVIQGQGGDGGILMQTCTHCGQPLDQNARFCPNCGASAPPPPPPRASGGFCHNCGELLSGDAGAFCPNCGACLDAAPPPPPPAPFSPAIPAASPIPVVKKPAKARRILPFVALFAVVLAGAGAAIAFFTGVFASPADKFLAYQKELLLEKGLSDLMDNTRQINGLLGLSTDMTLTARVDDPDINQYLDGSALRLKVDMDKRALLANLEFDLMGSTILTGALTYDNGTLGFCLPELDDTYYLIDLAQLARRSGGIEGLEDLEIPTIPADLLHDLAQCYINVVLDTVNKDNVTQLDGKVIRLDGLGKTVDGQTYVFRPSAEDIEGMVLRLADTLEKDKNLRGFVTTLLGSNQALIERATGVDLEDILDDALAQAANNLRAQAEEIGRTMESSGFCWYLGVSGGKVCMQRLELDGGDVVLAYESYRPGKGERHDLYYMESYGSRDLAADLTIAEENGRYSGECVLTTSYDQELYRVSFRDVDKTKRSALGACYGDYQIIMPVDYSGDLYAMNFSVMKAAQGGTDHIFDFDSLADLTYTEELRGLTVTLHTTDQPSTAAKPRTHTQDITNYDWWQYEELMERLSDTLTHDVLSQLDVYYR